MIVADSSAILALIAPDEIAPREVEAAILANPLTVPAHWAGEVANALWMMQRRKRIEAGELDEVVGRLVRLVVEQDVQPTEHWLQKVLPLATEHKLTVYDAAYLELAKRRRLPLATLDGALRKAARSARIELV